MRCCSRVKSESHLLGGSVCISAEDIARSAFVVCRKKRKANQPAEGERDGISGSG